MLVAEPRYRRQFVCSVPLTADVFRHYPRLCANHTRPPIFQHMTVTSVAKLSNNKRERCKRNIINNVEKPTAFK